MSQPLTPADCARQGIPLPEGATYLNAWHRTENGAQVLRTHEIARNSQGSIEAIMNSSQD